MSESSPTGPFPPTRPTLSLRRYALLVSVLAPVVAAALVYQLDSFDPAHLPTHEFARSPVTVPRENKLMLNGAEKIGAGKLLGPEDFAYDPDSGVVYTSCADGWVKRITVTESVVEEVVNTGGRPLGLALGRNNEVIVADSYKGLLNVSKDGRVEVLTTEAEGVEFKLTDGVDVAADGVIYFTDASHKYRFKDFVWDLLEGRPYGRFLSYDPASKRTKVLLSGLYFPNGVAVSPDQQFVVFCETPLRRCMKYYIQGEKKGSVDIFIDCLPGMPDNIRFDAQGPYYWIALPTAVTYSWDLSQKYPFLRKVGAIMERYVGRPQKETDGGFLAVDLGGKPVAYYHDRRLALVTGAIRIGDLLYCGSIVYPYIIRLNLTQYPALPVTVA